MCRRTFFVPSRGTKTLTRCGRRRRGRRRRPTPGGSPASWEGARCTIAGYFFRLHPADFKVRLHAGRRTRHEPRRLADHLRGPRAVLLARRAGGRRLGRVARAPVRGTAHGRIIRSRRSSENAFAKQIDQACAKLGYHPFPTPRAILSLPYRGRQPCMFCAMCASYGCEIGAKSSTLVSVLPAAEATGHCEIRSECMATQIPVNDAGRVTGVGVPNQGRRGGLPAGSLRRRGVQPRLRARGSCSCRSRHAFRRVSPTLR